MKLFLCLLLIDLYKKHTKLQNISDIVFTDAFNL